VLLAKARIGELTKALPREKAGREGKSVPGRNRLPKHEALAADGISRKEAAECERIADLKHSGDLDRMIDAGARSRRLLREHPLSSLGIKRHGRPPPKLALDNVPRRCAFAKQVRDLVHTGTGADHYREPIRHEASRGLDAEDTVDRIAHERSAALK
jgi:hypothetical protein